MVMNTSRLLLPIPIYCKIRIVISQPLVWGSGKLKDFILKSSDQVTHRKNYGGSNAKLESEF